MSENNLTDILKRIEIIFNEYQELKATFKPLEYPGVLGKDQDEIAKINGLITKIKVLISSKFNENSPYFKQVELHSKGKNGMCGRNDLNMVMSDLKVIYDAGLKKMSAIKESKEKLERVKEALIKYADTNDLSTIFGSDKKISVKRTETIKFPKAKSENHDEFHDNMFCLFPDASIEFMQQKNIPWIAFKVLAGGAIHPSDGFQFAFANGADFICVGMFDWQIVDDVNIALEVLPTVQQRQRKWMA